MREWQKADLIIGAAHLICALQDLHLKQHIALREHGALGRACCSRCIGEHHEIIRLDGRSALQPFGAFFLFSTAAEIEEPFKTEASWVVQVAKPFHVHNDDAHKAWRSFAHGEHLVELLLVLGKVEARAAVIDQILDLRRRIGGVDAIGDAACAVDALIGVEPFSAHFRCD